MKRKKLLEERLMIEADNNNMNEIANIEDCIIVHNNKESEEEPLKFAHFHYKNIHFKFKQQLPENVVHLRDMIAFKREQRKIKLPGLGKLLEKLQSKPSDETNNYENVYDYVLDKWKTLNKRDVDYID